MIKWARTKVVRARCTPGERHALIAVAEIEERHPSEMLRELIRKAAIDYGIWPPDEEEIDIADQNLCPSAKGV